MGGVRVVLGGELGEGQGEQTRWGRLWRQRRRWSLASASHNVMGLLSGVTGGVGVVFGVGLWRTPSDEGRKGGGGEQTPWGRLWRRWRRWLWRGDNRNGVSRRGGGRRQVGLGCGVGGKGGGGQMPW